MKRLWLVVPILLLAVNVLAAPPGAPPAPPMTTTLGSPGVDTQTASEKAIRTAITAAVAGGSLAYTDIVALFGGGSCSGMLLSSGSCMDSTNPAFGTINVTGANALNLGTSGSFAGSIRFKSDTGGNNYYFQILGSNFGANIGWILPTAAPGGKNYLLNVDDNGTMGYTDPSTLGNSPTIAGTGLTASRAYYMGASALALAKADSSTTMPAICVSDSTTTCRYSGVVVLGSAVAGCTRGKQAYVSAATAGLLTCNQPTSSGSQVQRVGTMVADDNASILVMPSLDVFTAP